MIKTFLSVIILSLFSVSTYAGDEVRGDPDLQRVNLETTINERAKTILSAYTAGQQFNVQTQITLKAIEIVKADPSKNGNAQKTAENEIVLGKLDLAAPMYGQLMNSAEDGKEFGNSIFSRIQKVVISAYVPKFVLTTVKDQIEKQLKTIGKISSQTQVAVNFEEMIVAKISKEDEESWSFRRWIVEFKNSIGIVLGAFVLSFFIFFLGFLIMRAYKKVESKKISMMEDQNALEVKKFRDARESKEKEQEKENELAQSTESLFGNKAEEAVDWSEMEDVDSGFDRFNDLLSSDPESASGMVRSWIQNPAKNGPFEALLTLPQVVDSKALGNLFSLLTMEERKIWRSTMNERMAGPTAAEVKITDTFISRQIVEAMLIPNLVVDIEFKKLLQSLTFKDCMELIMSHPEYAPVLINYLPTTIVSRIYTLLPQEKADDITLLSVKFKESEFAEKLDSLKNIVQEIVSGGAVASGAPFVENISDLLKTVSNEKEKSIWNALLEANEINVIRVAALRMFPSHLIPKLPGGVLKQAIDRFNTAKKADFISALTEQDRKFYLEVCGKEGSKVREMLDYELTQIESNEIRKKKNLKQAPQLQKEYVDIVRSFVVADESIRDAATEIVNQWIDKTGHNDSEQRAA